MNFEKIKNDKNKFSRSAGGDLEPETECYQLYKEFLATGKYPYLTQVRDFVCEKLKITDLEGEMSWDGKKNEFRRRDNDPHI